jgi:hypothetical protein
MLPACRTDEAAYTIPTFDVVPGDVERFMDEWWEFQSAFHDCFARSEPRAHFFDKWLQVLGTAECSQVDQGVRHHLHALVPLLDAFKAEQHPLECVFPRKRPLDAQA